MKNSKFTKPQIKREETEVLYKNKYLNLYGMHYDNGAFYLQCSRKNLGELTVFKSEKEYENMKSDAVTIVLVVKTPGEEPRLYLEHEFRYPANHFLLSPPAGLIDPDDRLCADPYVAAAKREIKEETGITVKETDRIFTVSPLFFSSPGMTDESNAVVCAVVELSDLSGLTDSGKEATECFDGYSLLTRDETKKLIMSSRDENGRFFSIYTWAVMMWFACFFEDL